MHTQHSRGPSIEDASLTAILADWGLSSWNWRVHARLWVSLLGAALSIAFLVFSPWYLVPIGWVGLGSSMFGLSSVVSSCALGTFTKFSWINSIVGTILGFPLILSFTGLRTCMQQASDSIMAVADSSMWWITGFFAFHKSNFRTWTNKRTAANNVLLYTFLLAFVSILCMVAGVSGLAKFYLAPLVVFYLWHSISIKVGRSLQVTFEHDETITKLISSISKQYEHQAISLPNVSRLVAKGNHFLLHQRNHTFISAFESLFGWEQVTPSDIAFQSLQQFKMVDTATLRSQAAKVIESEEVEFVNTPEPVNRSWDTYHFDVSKTLKLLGIHGAGLYGVYLLMTADIHPYTKVFAFIHYFFCGLGITGGYHRLWAHKTYEAPLWVQALFAFFGAGTGEGSILWWSRDHRMHHKFGDSDKDPYPIVHGFWWAHIGWLMFTKSKTCLEAGKKLEEGGMLDDLKAQRLVRLQHKYYGLVFLSAAFVYPALVSALWGETLWNGIYFAGAVPLFFSFQSTMCVNSLAHMWGERPYNTKISAVQNVIVAVITGGEGWHNYHHAFPMDYRAADQWYQWNPTKWLIQLLCSLGLAWNLRVQKRRPEADKQHAE